MNEKKKFYSRSLIKIISSVQNAIDEAISLDPVITKCLNFKYHYYQIALQIYEELYKNYINQLIKIKIILSNHNHV